MSAPNPAHLANLLKREDHRIPPRPEPRRIAVAIEPDRPAKYVRPGLRDEVIEFTSDGVFKTKHLLPGQRVRPYAHGAPRGGERIVRKVESVSNGAYWRVTWASGHTPSEHKAAYRWFDESMEGEIIQRVTKRRALVAYEEV